LPHPSHPRRLAIATVTAVAGLALVAPQWVSATPAAPPAESVPAASAPAIADTPSRPTLPEVAGPVASATPVAAPAEVEVPQVAAAPVPAPHPVVAESPPAPAPPVVPAPPAVAQTPEPAAPAARTTGSLTVHVSTAEGATRTVSLQTPAGDAIGERTTVTGAPITFADLAPGTYELFVEHLADGGGTFLTRTVLTVAAGEDRAVSCHDESLECSP
jgi:hypothetical protein